MSKNIWILIPAYNEENNVSGVLKKARHYSKNIILIDDGSKDNTHFRGREAKVTVLRHIVNMGKGAALKTGCDYALQHNAKVIVCIDADNQHNPDEIPDFLNAIRQGYAVVFGFRKFNKDMPFIFQLGNKVINLTVRLLYRINLRDTQCGFRAFTADAYKKIRWKANDYSMESEMIANTGKHKLAYTEIPIATIYSDKYKGTTIFDGIKIVLNMLFWRLGWS